METIEIEGRQYQLKLTFANAPKVEKALGKSVFAALGVGPDGGAEIPRIGDLATLFWGCLQYGLPNATKEQSDELLDKWFDQSEDNDIGELTQLIVRSCNFIKAQRAPIPQGE